MSGDNETIHVLCATDEGYTVPAAVTLRSIARTLRPHEHCVAHVVGLGLSSESWRRLSSLATDRMDIVWHEFDHAWLDALPASVRPAADSYLNDSVYVRLFLDAILPDEVGRVIFIDVDVLVRHSLGDLWALDLDGAMLGAARDVGVPALAAPTGVAHWRRLGLEPTAPYLNAGVLLIDRERWRDADVARRALEYVAEAANEVRFHDQEALNVCLAGRWKQLPLSWNAQAQELEFVLGSGVKWIWANVTPDEVDAARRDPAIVHFAGERKPWHRDSRVPWRDAWFETLEETGWGGPTPQRSSPRLVRAVSLLKRRLRRAAAALTGRG